MNFKNLKHKLFFKLLTNWYIIILLVFLSWMLFFDENSYLVHRELNDDIEGLENQKKYYLSEIKEDKSLIEKLNTNQELERFARETYFMKKANEDIYLIEFDTIKK